MCESKMVQKSGTLTRVLEIMGILLSIVAQMRRNGITIVKGLGFVTLYFFYIFFPSEKSISLT